MSQDEHDVARANQRFYDAFEARDLDAMAAVWERTDRATITHPGWPTLRGWAKVLGSWDAIFRNTPYIQFFLTEPTIEVDGDIAWVTLNESILQAEPDQGDRRGALFEASVAAVNLFARSRGEWRMVLHHGSAVGRNDEERPGEASGEKP